MILKYLPRNYIVIRDLIDEYINLNDEQFNQVIKTLEITKKFLAATALDYQKNEKNL